MADSFPDLIRLDHIWAEAIRTSHLWNERGPLGQIRDVPFLCLITTRVWDQKEEGRCSTIEIKTMRYMVAIGGHLTRGKG